MGLVLNKVGRWNCRTGPDVSACVRAAEVERRCTMSDVKAVMEV
jgi:hypothetical protein